MHRQVGQPRTPYAGRAEPGPEAAAVRGRLARTLRVGNSMETRSRSAAVRAGQWGGQEVTVSRSGVPFQGDEHALELGAGAGLHNLVNTLKTTEWYIF